MAAAAVVSSIDDVATPLYHSDDPETLGVTANRNGESVLFGFSVTTPDVVRFPFYHWLKDGATRIIGLRALNLSDAPADLAWRGSDSASSTAIVKPSRVRADVRILPSAAIQARQLAHRRASSSIVDIYAIPDNASSSPVVLTLDPDDASVAAGWSGSIVHLDLLVSPSNLA